MILAREVIEKGAFADVSRLGDVLNSRFDESLLGEEVQCRAEE
jgi:hypothetical protein